MKTQDDLLLFTMARWRNSFEHDTRQLISNLTGFKEREENFSLCLQFATSNFRFHRFLDVDSHKVTKALNGMIEKFSIHSQQEKATILTRLCDEFLDTPCFEGRTVGKTDTHYAIISLLLNLADSPTSSVYTEKPKILTLPEPKDDFDWGGFLMDGEEISTIYGDSDSESETEPLSEESDVPHVSDSNEAEVATPVNPPDPDLSAIPTEASTLYEIEDEPPTVASPSHESGFNWLAKNVTVQYWCGQSREQVADGRHNNLAQDWERYKEATDLFHSSRQHVFMSEIQILREILWMLSGASDSFVFVYNGNDFLVRESVLLDHLTDNALESCLKLFAKYGSQVQSLQKFEDEVIRGSYSINTGDGKQGVCQTYQAFSNSISNFLKDMRKELTSMEQKIIKQEEMMTLTLLHAALLPWLHKTDIIYSVYKQGIEDAEWLTNNCQRASHLLSVLYESVVEYDTLGQFANETLDLLLPVWIQTTKPYLDIIDEWITNGNLVDPMQEFLLKRNDSVKSLDESFWETAFTIHIPTDQSEADTTRCTKTTDGSRSQSKVGLAHLAPEFLEPIVVEVVLAGKSMEMLQGLGKLAEVVGGKHDIFYKEKSLYTTFLESLQDHFGVRSEDVTVDQSDDTSEREASLFEQQIEKQMKIKGIYDPLLKINFQNIFTTYMKRLKRDVTGETYEDSILSSLQTERLQPVDLMLRECLYPHVKEKYNKVCQKLVQILKDEYHLMDYLAAMRHYFLMEGGDLMFDFYTPIFDKIRLGEQWRNVSLVNLILDEALQAQFSEEINRLTISIEDLPKERKAINITDCLRLHLKVPWPLDVVISSRCQNIYNQVFTFLLQVKRAKYCLDELRFCDLEKENLLQSLSGDEFSLHLDDDMSRHGRIHRMQILRMRLIYFVNSLHNYMMTRILHSTGLEFKEEIERTTDLDQMIAVHNKYINTIHERCLLHKKVSFIKEAVSSILNLVLAFQGLWDKGIQEISLKTIEGMEKEFTRCIQFLASFLNNVIKRGSFPHLESLAFSLLTSSEHLIRS